MFGVRIFSFAALIATALGGVGPQAIYNRLNGQTFNPPGYTIVMYQSCMQNQNAGNPCGSFSTFESSNGVYTYQRYGPEAPVSPTCSRTFHLTLACGATTSMSGVNENPTCVYSATLTLPEVCGIDMTVGNEAASISGTAVPATPSRSLIASSSITSSITVSGSVTETGTGTLTPTTSLSTTSTITTSLVPSSSKTTSITVTGSVTETGTGTSTPLFEFTMFPSRTTSPSIPPTTTPLFMVTAWPTVSPVNVSAAAGLAEALGITPGSQTATILGAVAVGVLGVALVVGAIIYLKKGGSVAGLVQKVKENKGLITKAASMLPLTNEQKAKLEQAVNDPTALLPKEAQQVIDVVQHAKEYQDKAISSLPISESQKAQLTSVVSSVQNEVIKKIDASPTGVLITSVLGTKPVVPTEKIVSKQIEIVEAVEAVEAVATPEKVAAVEAVVAVATPEKVETVAIQEKQETQTVQTVQIVQTQEIVAPVRESNVVTNSPSVVAVHINTDDLAAFREFMKTNNVNKADKSSSLGIEPASLGIEPIRLDKTLFYNASNASNI